VPHHHPPPNPHPQNPPIPPNPKPQKVYLDISDEIKFAWKIQRDMAERGHSLDSIKKSIESRKPDFDAYIDPQKKHADMIIQVGGGGSFVCVCVCVWLCMARECVCVCVCVCLCVCVCVCVCVLRMV
jgi:hypothetical protein